jgi:hypothetical protein
MKILSYIIISLIPIILGNTLCFINNNRLLYPLTNVALIFAGINIIHLLLNIEKSRNNGK